ncbi:hypothetical protein VTN00DRAFT_5499 [Thermoascus crustaceus]|uniref:uncharacterized protein n=1 Tax=Thermoascus crustaceus TaxID=5088 RepID=UPI0037440C66
MSVQLSAPNENSESVQPPDPLPPPPDGGYGWVCVAACFCVNCFTWGAVSQTYGIYLAHYLSSGRFPEATPIDYALVGGLNFSTAMLVAPGVTIFARHYSVQAPMLLGTILIAIGFISASFAHRIWQLYLTQGVLIGAGVGCAYIPSTAIISQWFEKKRSLANGISSAGSGIGGIVYSFLTEAVIGRVSLAWALRITAVVSCSVLLVATLLIRTRNGDIRPSQRGFDFRLLRRRPDVWLLLAWGFLSMFGYITLLFSLPDYARSIGLSSAQAAAVSAVLNLGTAIGRPLIGLSSDHFGRIEVAGLLTCASGLACLAIWMPATSYGVLLFFAVIIGAILGVFWVVSQSSYPRTIGPICVEVAGLAELQSLLSLSWFATVLPTTFSEVIALKLRRPRSGREYLHPQIFCVVSYFAAGLCLLALWWRIRLRSRVS